MDFLNYMELSDFIIKNTNIIYFCDFKSLFFLSITSNKFNYLQNILKKHIINTIDEQLNYHKLNNINNIIISGGYLPSLLLNEQINDIDIYFSPYDYNISKNYLLEDDIGDIWSLLFENITKDIHEMTNDEKNYVKIKHSLDKFNYYNVYPNIIYTIDRDVLLSGMYIDIFSVLTKNLETTLREIIDFSFCNSIIKYNNDKLIVKFNPSQIFFKYGYIINNTKIDRLIKYKTKGWNIINENDIINKLLPDGYNIINLHETNKYKKINNNKYRIYKLIDKSSNKIKKSLDYSKQNMFDLLEYCDEINKSNIIEYNNKMIIKQIDNYHCNCINYKHIHYINNNKEKCIGILK